MSFSMKSKMQPSKEVENSLKSFARSYNSVFLKNLGKSKMGR